jgi:hypothetical protein
VKFRALLVAALALAPDLAFAQQVDDRARAAARTLAEDGVNALQSGDTDSAVDKLERAYAIVKLPTVGLWAARALVKAGRLVNASERYNEVTRWSGAPDSRQDQAKADAARENDALAPRIPSATLVIDGAQTSEASVSLDGEAVASALVGTAIPVDPRHHVARATRGTEVAEQQFDVAESQRVTVTLKFGGGAAPPPATTTTGTTTTVVNPSATTDAAADTGGSKFWNTQRTVGVAVGGAGVVAAVVSGIFTAGALSKKSDAKDAGCNDDGACTSQKGVDLLSDARSSGTVATITGIAGIAMIGAGVVLFVTAPSSSSGATVGLSTAPLPGGGFLTARGTF